ncbi:unnamed protein product [Penicillium olsonii]|nr:unnamed protein product [Penicillium olsonii]
MISDFSAPTMSGITRGHSCTLCQRRKVRCDKQKPCGNCVKAKAECTVIPQRLGTKRNTPRPVNDLAKRLKKYEELMSRHGIDFSSNLDDAHDPDDPETSIAGNPPSIQSASSRFPSRTHDQRNSKWFAYYNEYQTTNQMFHSGSNEESDRPTVHRAFDAMFDETIGFPFITGNSPTSTGLSLPSSIQSIQLWQIYINNINPLLGISHIPTLQSRFIEASTDLSQAPEPLRALMFGIYFTAVNSMTEDEVQAKFGETKSAFMAMTREGTERTLLSASFMKSNDIMVLQAYVLYLIGLRLYVDPRSQFCYIGIAVRIATRLGLHRDGAQFGISPFETEQRRRLWWQIVVLDKRIADITGSPTSALTSMGTDCRFPLNVNDIDLHPDAKEPPSLSTAVTESTFPLTRIEIMIASAPDGIRPDPKVPRSFQAHDGSSALLSKRPPREQTDHLDRYCAYMDSTYLKKCNLNIPIQLFTFLMTRVSLYKLRVLDFICRDDSSADGDDKRRGTAFSAAIDLLESDNQIHHTESLHGFIWYSQMQMPLPGYLFLANELCHRTTGDHCQRAWNAILQSPYHQGLSRNLRSPLHVGLGQAILKAWDARQNAEMQLGRSLQQPDLVAALRISLVDHCSGQAPKQPSAQDTEGSNRPCSPGPCQMNGTADLLFNPTSTYQPTGPMHDVLPSIEMDYNEMAWTNLMQSGAIGGFWGNLESLGE